MVLLISEPTGERKKTHDDLAFHHHLQRAAASTRSRLPPTPLRRAPSPPLWLSTTGDTRCWRHTFPHPLSLATTRRRRPPPPAQPLRLPLKATLPTLPPLFGRRPVLRQRQKTVPNRLPRLSITGEPTGAGSFPPRRSSSPGRSTCSSHHAQIDGAVRWSLPRLRAVQCCSAPIDFNHQPARCTPCVC